MDVARRRPRGDPLDDALARADFVSLHCPLTDETRGLIGAAELRAMKPTAILVNTARGPIVRHGRARAGARRGLDRAARRST